MKTWTKAEVKKLQELSKTNDSAEIAEALGRSEDSVRNKMKRLGLQPKSDVSFDVQVKSDIALQKTKAEKGHTSKKLSAALEEIEHLQTELDVATHLNRTPQEVKFTVRQDGKSEATAFIVASDWHLEELVKPDDVSGLNQFNLAIADKRIGKFFPNALKLLDINRRDSHIKRVVVALLGDFISGSIHDELMESNQLLPADAIWKAQNYLMSGIQFLLDNSDYEFTIACHGGNHGRMTKKQRHSTEVGNSLEVIMYRNIAHHFRGNKRVNFIIAEGYHTYIDVSGFVVRLHHGHNIQYGGGVGGIFIPTNKAIAQWNRGRRADLDVFGHFHQFKDGGTFICNGSLIGYNAYALSIKADFEPPKQAFFIVNHERREKSIVAPIWVT